MPAGQNRLICAVTPDSTKQPAAHIALSGYLRTER
jgi:hypothetical protein